MWKSSPPPVSRKKQISEVPARALKSLAVVVINIIINNNRNHFAHNMAVRVECGSCKLHSADQRGSEVQERAASRRAAKLEISYSHRECPTPRCL